MRVSDHHMPEVPGGASLLGERDASLFGRNTDDEGLLKSCIRFPVFVGYRTYNEGHLPG